jgi:predicted nucleotidyltransferase
MDNKRIKHIIKEYVSILKQIVKPQLIVLYGSYINGKPTKLSDVDLAVFLKKEQVTDYLETEKSLYKLSGQIDSRLEPNLFFVEDINKSEPSSFVAEILKTGKIVYQNR